MVLQNAHASSRFTRPRPDPVRIAGISGTRSGVAHFAHLGGMLFGWLLIQQWRGRPPFSRRPGGGGNVRRF